MVGTMMFGNNNCQLKIKDIRMGPVDPGFKSDSKIEKGESETVESDETDNME